MRKDRKDAVTGLNDIWTLVRDDKFASSFQSLGQYRTALLTAFSPILCAASYWIQNESIPSLTPEKIHTKWITSHHDWLNAPAGVTRHELFARSIEQVIRASAIDS